MPRLKNVNHEKLAQAYAKEALQVGGRVVKTRIYQKVYKDCSYDAARSQASATLAKPLIQARIKEIIASRNHPEDIAEDLSNLRQAKKEIVSSNGKLVEVVDNPTRLGAVQTCLKVFGGFDECPVNDNRQITFNIGESAAGREDGEADSKEIGLLMQVIEKLSKLNERLQISNESPDVDKQS